MEKVTVNVTLKQVEQSLKRLKSKGLVAEKDGKWWLTKKGLKVGRNAVKRTVKRS